MFIKSLLYVNFRLSALIRCYHENKIQKFMSLDIFSYEKRTGHIIYILNHKF